jgi:hypothetical protein
MTESVMATLGANSSFTLSVPNLTAVPPPLTFGLPERQWSGRGRL